jgi:hypothetical protein
LTMSHPRALRPPNFILSPILHLPMGRPTSLVEAESIHRSRQVPEAQPCIPPRPSRQPSMASPVPRRLLPGRQRQVPRSWSSARYTDRVSEYRLGRKARAIQSDETTDHPPTFWRPCLFERHFSHQVQARWPPPASPLRETAQTNNCELSVQHL